MILLVLIAFGTAINAQEIKPFSVNTDYETFQAVQKILDFNDDLIEKAQKNNWLTDHHLPTKEIYNWAYSLNECPKFTNLKQGIALNIQGCTMSLLTPWGCINLLGAKFHCCPLYMGESQKPIKKNQSATTVGRIPTELCLLSSISKRLTLRLREYKHTVITTELWSDEANIDEDHSDQGGSDQNNVQEDNSPSLWRTLIKDVTVDTDYDSIENRNAYIQKFKDDTEIEKNIGTNKQFFGEPVIYDIIALDGNPLPEIQEHCVPKGESNHDYFEQMRICWQESKKTYVAFQEQYKNSCINYKILSNN